MIDALTSLNRGYTTETVPAPGIVRETELFDPWIRQAGDSVVALHRAVTALRHAVSHRDFLVSACGVTLLDEELAVSYIHGQNNKPSPHGGTDAHAEEEVLDHADGIARTPISALAVIADAQPDDTRPLDAPTLLPCYRRCLPRLESSRHIRPETLLLGATMDLGTVQYYDVAGLRDAYETGRPDLLTTVTFETPGGADHEEWREKLIGPLGLRALHLH